MLLTMVLLTASHKLRSIIQNIFCKNIRFLTNMLVPLKTKFTNIKYKTNN